MRQLSHRAKRILECLGVGGLVLAVAFVIRYKDPGPVAAVRALTFDYFQRISPRPQAETAVRIVDIDEASLKALGQWPWPRTKTAALVRQVADLGAAVIALDMFFPEPDRSSPTRILDNYDLKDPTAREQLTTVLGTLPDHDEALASAIADAPVVLAFSSASRNAIRPLQHQGYNVQGTSPTAYLKPLKGATVSLPILQKAAKGEGIVDRGEDQRTDEGVTRTISLVATDGKELYSGLSLEALRVAQDGPPTYIKSSDASGEVSGGVAPSMVSVRVGDAVVPTTARGKLTIYYNENRPDRYVSAAAVLDPAKAAEIRPLIEGHIVFIGTSATGLLDTAVTPLGETVPGVMIHAQAVEQILSGKFLSRPDWADGFELTSMVVYSLLVAGLLVVVSARFVAVVIATVILAVFAGAILAFQTQGLLLDPVFTAVTATTVFVAVTGVLYMTSDREKRFIRQAFGQYLAPEVLARLEAKPELLALGGEIKEITILFMDVRGFTTISERLSAHEITTFMNALLSPLSDAIQKEQGTIDKYIGDSIMAFWNAPLDVPNHAARACRAALAMIAIVERMNADDAFGLRRDHGLDLDVEIGIGLNTGEACVGNMGSESRFNYSALGDTVNAGARIESSCKEAGWPLLISEQTRAEAPGFATLEVGPIALKGKKEPLVLHALVGDDTVGASDAFRELAAMHGRLVDAIDAGQPEIAAEALLRCRALALPGMDRFYDRFADQVKTRTGVTLSTRAPEFALHIAQPAASS
jgi:adenylate cyclase